MLVLCKLGWSINNVNETIGYCGANHKIKQMGDVIKVFCDNDSQRLKGYKCTDKINGKGDLFGLLMYCYPQLNKSELYIKKLKKIQSLTSETVSGGIAKMNKWETFEELKLRALNNIEKVKTAKGKADYYSDVNVVFTKPENNVNNNHTTTATNDYDNKDSKEEKET